MAKVIVVIAIVLMCGAIFGAFGVGNLFGFAAQYIIKPLASVVRPVAKIFEIFLSFRSLNIVFGVLLVSWFMVFVINKFTGRE